MWMKVITGILLFAGLVGCQTVGQQVVRADHHKRFVEVQSSGDERTAMPPAVENRDFRIAVAKLEKQAKKQPSHDLFVNLSQLYLVMGKLVDAEKAAQKAIRLKIKSQSARLVLAQISLRKNNPDMALILMNSIGGEESRDSQVLNMLAMIALKKREPREAMRHLTRALELNPSDVAVRMNLGVTYLRYRQLPEASAQFERVLAMMPDHADARLHLAIVQSARQDFDYADETFNAILASRESNPLALYNLAILEKRRNNYEKSLSHLKIYLKTGAAKKQDVDNVFALINEIQEAQGAKYDAVASDREIQALAAQGDEARYQRQAKAQRKADVEDEIEDFNDDLVAEEIDDLEDELLNDL